MLMMKISGVALGVVLMGAPVWAQHGTPPQQQGEAQSLQGDTSAWVNNAYMHQFYDLTVETLGKGASSVDFDAYRDKSYAIFRAFGVSMGGNPDMMVDHLKDIPRQLVGIVKDDPHVLDSYKNFTRALMGPE
jgi:hypothetical protein